jgi:D-alanyl-D-alanine carboxypeptidase
MLRCFAVTFLLLGAVPAQGPLDAILATLEMPASAAQLAAMRAAAARPDAPAAIPGLLAKIRAEAPALDNDGCLALEQILRAHPDATCPVDVLLEVVARPIWTSRQKGAQALALALRPEVVAGQRERLARAVIPLLASQRERVYSAGARCLAAIAGRDLGDDPAAARAWFFATFGKGIDLVAAVHEEVVVVRPQEDGGFRVQGEPAADLAELTAKAAAARELARARGLEVGAVVVLPKARVDALLERGDFSEVAPVVRALADAGIDGATFAPDTDEFRPPFAEDEGALAPLRAQLAQRLGALRRERVPGAQAAVVLPDGRLVAFADGVADRTSGAPMPATGRLLAGSTGKTCFAALALQLAREGRLDLDGNVADWLGAEPWYARVPNAADITIRQLLQHRSGVMRYELSREFLRALRARPAHRFTAIEAIGFVLDRKPRFAAGEGFEYSDTNYLLLGMVLERITGRPCYDEIRTRFLEPLRLCDTVPSVGRRIEGLLQSHAAPDDPFGGRDPMLVDGELPFDPGFEGAGGGFATSAGDLARWAKALYEGEVLAGVRDAALAGLPAPLGPGARYGLGVMIEDTEAGPAWGHSGFFPGSMSAMRYYPDCKVAVAVLVNSSAEPRLGRELVAWTTALARLAAGK